MLFQKRVDRAFDHFREEQARRAEPASQEYDPKQLSEEIPLSEKIEKGDKLAMLISGLLVFLPAAILALLAIVGLSWLFMGV